MGTSSRERMLSTIAGGPTDHVPLSFLLLSGLQARCRGLEEFTERQLELGIDVVVPLGDPAWAFRPEVTTKVRVEPASPNPLLHKVYRTPAGELETVVEKTPDWPHGDDVPLFSDYIIPRARQFPVRGAEHLDALRYLLGEPDAASIESFRQGAKAAQRLADRHELATRGGFYRLSDTLCWLCGCEQFATMGLTEPDFFRELVGVVEQWQERMLRIVVDAGPDIVVDPQWYATTFLSPSLYEEFIAPSVERRVVMAHQAGATFCMLATTNVLPFAPLVKGLGVDVVFGVDPIEGGWDLAQAKAELGDTVGLWGGVNGYLTLADGTPEDVDRAVERAIEILAPGGRFILGAVDDVRVDRPDDQGSWERTWENVRRMADTWRRLC